MQQLDWVRAAVESREQEILHISREIWLHPELGLGEYHALEVYRSALRRAGFRVQEGLAGIPTAFCGEWGQGRPVIAFLGEYDALPGLSQSKPEPAPSPIPGQTCGHGCGHNNLGAGAFGAALAVADYLRESGRPGTVRFYGCPGEEDGSGKAFMAEAGCFSGVDACFTWHPSDVNVVVGGGSLAILSVDFAFHGRSAHASSSPELGRSALDAAELTSVGANYLREHIPSRARLHYAYQNAGGSAPNVVQDFAQVRYFVRAPKAEDALQIYARLCNVARGAALMTDTRVEIRLNDCVANYVPNHTLGAVLQQALEDTPLPVYSQKEQALAQAFWDTYSPEERNAPSNMLQRLELSPALLEGIVLHRGVLPYVPRDGVMGGSTDVGDVSHCVPTAQFFGVTMPAGTPTHGWQTTAISGSLLAETGTLQAARVLALAGIRVMEDSALLRRAKEECAAATGARPAGLMEPGQKPQILPNPAEEHETKESHQA